jgi:Cd(II)/Pb(II)-responsive transcriptional regulator
MRIGELAKATHCSVETIRYYEREGLLPTTTRSDGNYRNYTARHAERLRFVRNCRALDMVQGDIRELLNILDHPSDDCASVNKLVDRHFDRVQIRIRELESLRRQLAELRRR